MAQTLEQLMEQEAHDKKEKLLRHAQNEIDLAQLKLGQAKSQHDSAAAEFSFGWNLLNLPILVFSIWATFKAWPFASMLYTNMSKTAALEAGFVKIFSQGLAIAFAGGIMLVPLFFALLTFLWGIVIPISDYRKLQKLKQDLTDAETVLAQKEQQYRRYEAQ